ncbi:WbqC family protein [Runella sp.]|uniref:WbqC family protein n=1 Tax=Runella sp. TaxID=1960881 RepID=UPI00301A95DA
MTLRIELQYLPSLEYFACLLKYGEVALEAHEYFLKQTYRNRCCILTANGVDTLIVPVIHSSIKMPIREVKIDYSQSWVKRHWGAIVAGYGKAPYFEYFGSDFERVYQKKPAYLFDLNWELLTICLKLLRLKPTIRLTDSYQTGVEEGQIDVLSLVHPKKEFRHNNLYLPVVYQQNFGTEFVPNLSIIDLLMCQGAEAIHILKRSVFVD